MKQQRLLAILLLNPHRIVSTDEVVTAIWGDHPPATAIRQVRNTVSGIRSVTPGLILQTEPPGYRLVLTPDQLDSLRFDELVAGARAADDPAETVRLLRTALALWRGPALAGLDTATFTASAAYWDQRRLTVLSDCLDLELELGRHRAVAPELVALVEEFPFHEDFRRQVMLAMYRSGQSDQALGAYREAYRALSQGLGVAPGPQLRDLKQRILQRDVSLELHSATRTN